MAVNLWLGDKMQPILAPLASRGRPIPIGVKLAAGAVLAGLLLSRRGDSRR